MLVLNSDEIRSTRGISEHISDQPISPGVTLNIVLPNSEVLNITKSWTTTMTSNPQFIIMSTKILALINKCGDVPDLDPCVDSTMNV